MHLKTNLLLISIFIFNQQISFAQYSQDRQLLIQERLQEVCNKKPTIHLEYIANDIPVYTNKTYLDLQREQNVKLFGLYKNQFGIKADYKIGSFQIANQSCFFLSDIKFSVYVTPQIFIANEAAKFPCIREKVYQHELQHHQFFMNALNSEHEFLQNEFKQRFSFVAPKYSERDVSYITEYISNNTKDVQSLFQSRINHRKEPQDKRIDNVDNARKELSVCGHEMTYLNKLYN